MKKEIFQEICSQVFSSLENNEQLVETLKQAKEDAKLGYPVLVNVKLSKSDFRKGSISV